MLIDILGAIVVVLCGGRFRIPPTGGCRECRLPGVLSNLSQFPFHPPKSHKHTWRLLCKTVTQIVCKLRLFKNQRCVDCVVVHPRLCERLLLVTRTLSRAHQTNCRVRVQAFVQASSIMIYTTGDELYLNNIESTLFSVCNVKDVVETVWKMNSLYRPQVCSALHCIEPLSWGSLVLTPTYKICCFYPDQSLCDLLWGFVFINQL